jgi:hypothetical protein
MANVPRLQLAIDHHLNLPGAAVAKHVRLPHTVRIAGLAMHGIKQAVFC